MRFFFAWAVALLAGPAPAQDMEIPVATQIPLFFKVTSFDRRITTPPRDELVMVIAFQSGNRASNDAKDEAKRALADMPAIEGKTVRAVTVDLDHDDLRAALRDKNIAMLYLAPVRGVSIDGIAAAAQAAKVTTYTGVPKYVDQGIAVGVRRVGERPKLLVNLRVARLEGADFSAEFLKLVQVIQ